MENFRPYMFGNLQVHCTDLLISASQNTNAYDYDMIDIVPPSDVAIPVSIIIDCDLLLTVVINVSIQ